MQTFETLTDAIALAEFAHRKQVDKAGLPYIDHPKRVLATVQAMGVRPFVQVAAVLHDVVEDTKYTSQMLLDLGFSPAAVRLVDLVSRKKDVEKEDYYAAIAADPDATLIKIADIRDNTQAWRLTYLPEETQFKLVEKYHEAYKLLGQEAEAWGLKSWWKSRANLLES